MRVAIATVQVPFIHGGAEMHARGLSAALARAGHEVDIVSLPFSFAPAPRVRRAMELWRTEDFTAYNGYPVDRVICLKFPSWYCQHPKKVLWLLHQHRACYDLYGGDAAASAEDRALRDAVTRLDTVEIGAIVPRYTNSQTVSDRLQRFNGISAEPLYHPPPLAERLYGAPAEMFIFCPSRLESLKRQTLLIAAMAQVRSPVTALIAGAGGQEHACRSLIADLDVGDRVRLLGPIDDVTLLSCYAMSLGVFFGPRDEDYGYVTLQAMLAEKPVITCTDSGGPLEFVSDGETGLVVEPDPQAVADAIDQLAGDAARASDMGRAGKERYAGLGISWANVVGRLLA